MRKTTYKVLISGGLGRTSLAQYIAGLLRVRGLEVEAFTDGIDPERHITEEDIARVNDMLEVTVEDPYDQLVMRKGLTEEEKDASRVSTSSMVLSQRKRRLAR